MYNIIVLLLAAMIGMAKRRRRRKFRRYLRGQIDHTLAIGALDALDLIGSIVGDTVTETTWLSSIRAIHTLVGFTPAAGDGPILVGVSHSDYTDAEIEGWIENNASWSKHNLVAQEIAKRKIRRIGVFQTEFDDTIITSSTLNDGKPITTKCGWQLGSAQTIRLWAFNMGSSTLTTGALYKVEGHANLWPTD